MPVESAPPLPADVRWNQTVVDAFDAKDCGNFRTAERLFLAAIRLVKRDDDPRKSVTLRMMGDFYVEQNRYSQAIYCYEQDMKLSKSLGEDFPGLIYDLLPLAWMKSSAGQLKQAEQLLDQALKIAELNELIPESADATSQLGCIYIRTGRFAKAQDMLQALLKFEYSIKVADARMNLAQCFSNQHDYVSSVRLLESVADFKEDSLELMNEANSVAGGVCTLGCIYIDQKRYALAEEKLRHGLQLAKKPGISHPAVLANLYSWLAVSLVNQGRGQEAIPYLQKAAKLRIDPIANWTNSNARYLVRDRFMLKALQNKTDIPPAMLTTGW